MKEIRIPLEQFDLEGFLDSTLEFLREWMAPEVDRTHLIARVQSMGEARYFVRQVAGTLSRDSQKERWSFFHSLIQMATDCIAQIGSSSYYLVSTSSMAMKCLLAWKTGSAISSRLKDRTVLVNSAICTDEGSLGSAPRIDLYPNSGFLEKINGEFHSRLHMWRRS